MSAISQNRKDYIKLIDDRMRDLMLPVHKRTMTLDEFVLKERQLRTNGIKMEVLHGKRCHGNIQTCV